MATKLKKIDPDPESKKKPSLSARRMSEKWLGKTFYFWTRSRSRTGLKLSVGAMIEDDPIGPRGFQRSEPERSPIRPPRVEFA